MIDKPSLIKMAEHLETDPKVRLNMRRLDSCVSYYSVLVLEPRYIICYFPSCNEDYALIQSACDRIFGIPFDSNENYFCFGPEWCSDRYAAANRLRYVAEHGEAPPRSQWNDFYSIKDIKIYLARLAEKKEEELRNEIKNKIEEAWECVETEEELVLV